MIYVNRKELKETSVELLEKNGRALTILATLLIVITGVTLVDNPSRWWVSLLSVTLFGLIVLVFLNLRVLIKASIAVIVLIFEAGWAFKVGAFADPNGITGSLWMLSIIMTFFFVLSISYLKPSTRSRWSLLALTLSGGFLMTYILGALQLPMTLAIPAGALFTLAWFTLAYSYSRKTRYSKEKMPTLSGSPDDLEGVKRNAESQHWGAVNLVRRKQFRGLLVWNDNCAFVLVKVHFDEKLAFSGRKNPHLSHKGEPINMWLLDQIYQRVPATRTRGANIMLVLLDDNNRNGTKPRTVGVSLADSTSYIPVGIYPARGFLETGKGVNLCGELETEFHSYMSPLTPRQVEALDYKLPKEDEAKPETTN